MKGTAAVIGMRGWLVASGLLVLLLGNGRLLPPVQGQESRTVMVADVIITGNKTFPEQSILANLQTKKGREFSQATLEEDVRRLIGLGAFKDVRPIDRLQSDGTMLVEFTVVEFPSLVTDVLVKNNRHLQLDEVDALKRIKKGAPLNEMLNRQAALEIEDYYHSKGYLLASVKMEEGSNPTDKRVVFNVTEGPVVKIRSISFTGNEALATSARLKTQISSSPPLIPLVRLIGGVFNPQQIDADVLKLSEYYKNNGFLAVKITREVKFSEDYSGVDIVFHIHEGVCYRINEVTVDGIKNLPPTQVENILKTHRQDFYNGTNVETDLKNIKDLYGWRGYRIGIREEKFFSEDSGLVNVHYQVMDEVRPPAKVGEPIIVGNTVTKDRVIRRILGLYPGQTLRYPELRIAEANLNRLNLFENSPEKGIRPTVSVIEDPNNPDAEFKNILVQVQETYTGSFMLGVGVNSDAGLVGNIVLNERNFDIFRPPLSFTDILEGRAFRGGGQEFRLEASPGTQYQRYMVSLREPFLFDQPYSLTLAGYYNDRIFNEYTERRVGGRFTVGHQLDPNWSVSAGMRLENVNVRDVADFAPADYLDVRGDNFLVGPRVSLAYDRRDSYIRPSSGGFYQASAEYIFGDYHYGDFSLEGNEYFTIFQRRDGSGKQVLAARGQVAWTGSNTPVYDRFFAGGYQSLRGFEFRGVGPFVNGYNVGGDFMALGSLEYQVPVMANDNLSVVAFLDTGTVEPNVSLRNFRASAGFGARITVPMMGPVPIALDFGFPIMRGNGDRTQVFSFYVGLFH